MSLVDDYKMVLESPLFDSIWYFHRYCEMLEDSPNPLKHFMEIGWKEGCNPGPDFSCAVYLDNYKDVKESGMNPLLHYIKYGRSEKRKNIYYDLKCKKFVDEEWYMLNYPQYDYQLKTPLEWYLTVGWRKGDNPNPYTKTKDFWLANGDVQELDYAPIIYYEERMNPLFSALDKHVVHYWGVYVNCGRKYIILSAKTESIYIDSNGKKINGRKLNDNAFTIFDEYIFKEYEEQAFAFESDFLSVSENETFLVRSSDFVNVEIRVLFVWSCFSNKYLLGPSLFFFINKEQVRIVSKDYFKKEITKMNNPQMNNLIKISEQRETNDLMIFSEFRSITNDNSWQLFIERLKRNANTFFITNIRRIEKENDENIKQHLIPYNSDKHKEILFRANYIVCSWTLSDMVPTEIKHDFMLYPFLNDKWFYCPHGISYDKNSKFLSPIFLGYPAKLFCASQFEKLYFVEECGQKAADITGYPRMDKWSKSIDESILFDFTYRKHYSESYFNIIANTVKHVRKTFPKRNIYYLFHPAITKELQKKIKRMIGEKSIMYAHASDEKKFNAWFCRAKYLVTDYSSVAYDFSYKSDAIACYYMPKGFIEGHYELREEFWDNHTSMEAYSLNELIEVLKLKNKPEELIERQRKFFAFVDSKNTERVLNLIENCGE